MTDLNKLLTPLFLSDKEIRKIIELIFFSYRDFTSGPDEILYKINFGRAHHRVIYFVGKREQITIRNLLSILQITKQSLSRVLNQLVKEKYIQAGKTIDLGVMFIPSESLVQLIDSIEDLRKTVFRDSRVLVMGPNSLAAYLISIHMGFRNLALNERAEEILVEFGNLKKEFESFESSTEDLVKKAEAMVKAVDKHETRERQMNRALRKMEEMGEDTKEKD